MTCELGSGDRGQRQEIVKFINRLSRARENRKYMLMFAKVKYTGNFFKCHKLQHICN